MLVRALVTSQENPFIVAGSAIPTQIVSDGFSIQVVQPKKPARALVKLKEPTFHDGQYRASIGSEPKPGGTRKPKVWVLDADVRHRS